ncbi:acyltransferase [Pseudoalteromonas sp. JBTF-M23]|uniref:Acyltransferase n=1 Tax=Pseudoalteromonas caenipelagi TaxID=2726988 RepID=A0A849VAY5_9GAMM|nr:acyltransferase family protein [Pseudoalteromonas caenipelagi]NOU49144.1 acyltransferase [Pseudoalteromonas caenipelagi]
MTQYRSDIDGLRAIAVLIVLLFHLDIPFITGGFIGVDVFFTISGFLISSIIIKANANNHFSYIDFYIRRATRLLPAYLTVLVTTIIAGIIILTPYALSDLLRSAIASALFFSNIFFMLNESGYFSSTTHEAPLLHTWSLSVEEQFYLFMPLCIVLWMKLSKHKLRALILIFSLIAAYLVSYFLTQYSAKLAYYFIASRAGEFLIGTAVAVCLYHYPEHFNLNKFASNCIFVISLALILVSAMNIDSKDKFPGLLTLLPCFGVAGIIIAGKNLSCWSYSVLGNKYLVFIGLISYSLYLWHWPIISYLKVLGIEFTAVVQLCVATLSMLLAYLTWRYVENPTRHSKTIKTKKVALLLYTAPAAALVLVFFVAHNAQFFPHRFDQTIVQAEVALHSKPEQGKGVCMTNDVTISESHTCMLGNKEKSKIDAVLWGDSHANHFNGFVDVIGQHFDIKVLEVSRGNCPPLLSLYVNTTNAREACIKRNNDALAYILDKKPRYVFLAGAWAGYTQGNLLSKYEQNKIAALNETIEITLNQLIAAGIYPIVIEMLPRQKVDNSRCFLKVHANRTSDELEDCRVSATSAAFPDISNAFAFLKDKYTEQASFVSVESIFCEGSDCPTYLNNIPIYRDNNHLNLLGSIELGKRFIKQNPSFL